MNPKKRGYFRLIQRKKKTHNTRDYYMFGPLFLQVLDILQIVLKRPVRDLLDVLQPHQLLSLVDYVILRRFDEANVLAAFFPLIFRFVRTLPRRGGGAKTWPSRVRRR